MRCSKVSFEVEHDPHWHKMLVEPGIPVEGECRGYNKAYYETPTTERPPMHVMTRIEAIYDDVLTSMAEAGIEDTLTNRLEVLTILRDKWLDEPSVETERSMYIIAIIIEIQRLERQLENALV